MSKRVKLLAVAAALSLASLSPAPVKAEDAIEKAGVGIGLSLGNIIVLPVKAIEVTIGALSGALSFVLTGNADLTRQIWRDTTEGPYAVTPEVAHMAIGKRPELQEKNKDGTPPTP